MTWRTPAPGSIQGRRVRFAPMRLAGAALAVTAGLVGCGGDSSPLDSVHGPSWFGQAADAADDDSDPERVTRTYADIGASTQEAEVELSQQLDRAGWQYHSDHGDCTKVGLPSSGTPAQDCWTMEGDDSWVLSYKAVESGPSGGSKGRTAPAKRRCRLTIVLYKRN